MFQKILLPLYNCLCAKNQGFIWDLVNTCEPNKISDFVAVLQPLHADTHAKNIFEEIFRKVTD